MTTLARCSLAALAITAVAWPVAASAQEKAPRRVRVTAGAQIVPDYPGADGTTITPLGGISWTREPEFDFSAPDQGLGFNLIDSGGFAAGPVANIVGSRKQSEVGAAVPKVKTTLELGGFVQYAIASSFRLRAEIKRGVSGHKAWVGSLGADFIARDADNWLFSIGPRVGYASNKYQDAYFSVTPATALATGLPAYNADSGVPTFGGAASLLYSFTPRWGIRGYGKYDRLVGDAADSPIVRVYGSRNQWSAGAALTYTFGGN